MGMYHSTSGKEGFDLRFTPTEYEIPRETLISVLKREDELRFSAQVQERYSASDALEHIRDVTVELQKQALREHGIDEDHGLVVLQNARFQYKDDPEFNGLTVYFRLDTSRRGFLMPGMVAPDAELYTLDGDKTSLSSFFAREPSKPLVIFAGSAS
mmetsp:Transcript_10887/g.34685  ORF Transcript_10887/g.34685 Transcript_10887/m.34685 type:complete len:156 (+) Transcript_10887:14-481(+)